MLRKTSVVFFAMMFAIVALSVPGAVFAQMNGHNLRGDYGLQSGSQPAPGWYGSLLYLNYNIDSVRSRSGDALRSAGGDITVQAISPILLGVTEKQVWGAGLQNKLILKSSLIKKRIVINMYKLPYIGRLGRLDDTFTIIKYEKMLLEDDCLNVDPTRKLQRLSARYFPK